MDLDAHPPHRAISSCSYRLSVHAPQPRERSLSRRMYHSTEMIVCVCHAWQHGTATTHHEETRHAAAYPCSGHVGWLRASEKRPRRAVISGLLEHTFRVRVLFDRLCDLTRPHSTPLFFGHHRDLLTQPPQQPIETRLTNRRIRDKFLHCLRDPFAACLYAATTGSLPVPACRSSPPWVYHVGYRCVGFHQLYGSHQPM